MKKDHVIVVTLKTTKSNISIPEGKIGHWYFNWQNNLVTAYALTAYQGNTISDPFDLIANTDKLNIGLLIDALSMCVNLDVNTSIAISTEINTKVYKLQHTTRVKTINDIIQLLSSAIVICNFGHIGEEKPKRIDESLTVTLVEERLKVMDFMLACFKQKISFTDVEMKLMNYWRRGVDLDNLTFWDESFLAFYKILEYFEKKANIKAKAIPTQYKTRTMKSAYRIAQGTGLTKLTRRQLELLGNFIYLRNHWDIAHTKTSSLPKERESALYYTYHLGMWNYQSHACQLTRLMILKQLGFNNFQLKNDGGLYKLVKNI